MFAGLRSTGVSGATSVHAVSSHSSSSSFFPPMSASPPHPRSSHSSSAHTNKQEHSNNLQESKDQSMEDEYMQLHSSTPSHSPVDIVSPSRPPSSLTSTKHHHQPRPATSDLRIQKDLLELSTHKMCAGSTRISFPDGVNNLRRLHVLVTPNSGLYAGSSFLFAIFIPTSYPFHAPRVRCYTRVLHPNINWRTGAVFLALLHHDWKPVLSINAVIFSLQLLFIEPWPTQAANPSSTSPRSQLVMESTTPSPTFAESCALSPPPPVGALALASSKSATTSVTRQFDSEAIINLELYPLVMGGERSTFEDLVSRTLEGGFFFGALWARNRIDNYSREEDADTDDETNTHRHSLLSQQHASNLSHHEAALIQQVEENGRKAHISPQHIRSRRRKKKAEHDDMTEEKMQDDSTSAAMHPIRSLSGFSTCVSPSPSSSLSPSPFDGAHQLHGSPDKRGAPHSLAKKRAFFQTSPNKSYSPNPAAALIDGNNRFVTSSMSTHHDDATSLHVLKKIKQQNMENRLSNATQEMKCDMTSGGRAVMLRRDIARPSAAASIQSISNHIEVNPRKRSQLEERGSFSEGEYEDDECIQDELLDCVGSMRGDRSYANESKDDGSTRGRVRRSKKFKHCESIYPDDNLEMEDSMMLDLKPRAPSTVLPDLATFSSFRPTDTGEAVARRSTTPSSATGATVTFTASSSSSLPQTGPILQTSASEGGGSSPKRNVSDCPSLSPDVVNSFASAMHDSISSPHASSSFLLNGRSSSRSINLFGDVKSQSGKAHAGLDNLQVILASLPRTSSNSMFD